MNICFSVNLFNNFRCIEIGRLLEQTKEQGERVLETFVLINHPLKDMCYRACSALSIKYVHILESFDF